MNLLDKDTAKKNAKRYNIMKVELYPLLEKPCHICGKKSEEAEDLNRELSGSKDLRPICKKCHKEKIIKTSNISNILTKLDCNSYEIINYKGTVLTTANLKKMSIDERNAMVYDLAAFFLQYNFKDIRYPDNVVELDIDGIKSQNAMYNYDINGSKLVNNRLTNGLRACRYFFPNILEIRAKNKESVIDILDSPMRMIQIIRNRLSITFFEIFNINPIMIIKGSKSTGLASHGSIFKPTVAMEIYKEFCKDGFKVYDYSAGFGGRMMGLFSSGKNCTYYACEPNTKTYDGLKELSKKMNIENKIKLYNKPSENVILDKKMDFIFSSPPYFDHEIYCDEKTQSYNAYPKYDDWLEMYWKKTVENIKNACHKDTIFGINIGNDENKKMKTMRDDIFKIIDKCGFKLCKTWYMTTSRSHLSNKEDNEKLEPIYFFKLNNNESKDSLGDRMKNYENMTNYKFDKDAIIVLRADGKTFSKWTKRMGFSKPFDGILTNYMQEVMFNSAQKMQGCVFAYTQSDEITFVLKPGEKEESEPWFGNRMQKILSIGSSIVTLEMCKKIKDRNMFPMFDLRAFVVPNLSEAANAIIWRQNDCIKNSISCSCYYESAKKIGKKTARKKMHGLNQDSQEKMLKEVSDKNWVDYESRFKYGSACYRVKDEDKKYFEFNDKLPVFAKNFEWVLKILENG